MAGLTDCVLKWVCGYTIGNQMVFKLPSAALEEERVVRFVGQAAGVVVRQTHSSIGAFILRDLHDTYNFRYILIRVTYAFISLQPPCTPSFSFMYKLCGTR